LSWKRYVVDGSAQGESVKDLANWPSGPAPLSGRGSNHVLSDLGYKPDPYVSFYFEGGIPTGALECERIYRWCNAVEATNLEIFETAKLRSDPAWPTALSDYSITAPITLASCLYVITELVEWLKEVVHEDEALASFPKMQHNRRGIDRIKLDENAYGEVAELDVFNNLMSRENIATAYTYACRAELFATLDHSDRLTAANFVLNLFTSLFDKLQAGFRQLATLVALVVKHRLLNTYLDLSDLEKFWTFTWGPEALKVDKTVSELAPIKIAKPFHAFLVTHHIICKDKACFIAHGQ